MTENKEEKYFVLSHGHRGGCRIGQAKKSDDDWQLDTWGAPYVQVPAGRVWKETESPTANQIMAEREMPDFTDQVDDDELWWITPEQYKAIERETDEYLNPPAEVIAAPAWAAVPVAEPEESKIESVDLKIEEITPEQSAVVLAQALYDMASASFHSAEQVLDGTFSKERSKIDDFYHLRIKRTEGVQRRSFESDAQEALDLLKKKKETGLAPLRAILVSVSDQLEAAKQAANKREPLYVFPEVMALDEEDAFNFTIEEWNESRKAYLVPIDDYELTLVQIEEGLYQPVDVIVDGKTIPNCYLSTE